MTPLGTRVPGGGVRGFTLMELLVVIAILGVLTSLLLPALASAKARARQTACLSNLRQLGLGMVLYADEFDGLVPLTTHGSDDARVSWVHTLRPFVGDTDAIRLCPADPRAGERRANRGTSYVLNEFLAVPWLDPFGRELDRRYRLDALPRPVETMMLFEIADAYGANEFADHTHSRGWTLGWGQVVADIQPDRHRSGAPSAERTRGGANYLFADGHVEKLRARQIKQQIDAGVNPADPDPVRRLGPQR